VLKAKPKVLAEGDGGAPGRFELKGALIPVLKDHDGRLRVRGYDGREGWADKADFVRVADAPAYFTNIIRTDEKSAWAWEVRGTAWSLNNELEKAVADYTRAIQLDPRRAGAYYARGGVWGTRGEYDKAIHDYSEAIRIDPNCHPMGPARLYNARGSQWAAKREYDRAIRDYDEAIRLDPTYALLFNHRGNAWFEKMEYDKAIRDYDECVRLGSRDLRLDVVDPSVFVNRGEAQRAKKQYAKALADYDVAIRLDPKYAMALSRKAYLLATCADDKLRDVASAAETMKGVVRLRPASPYNEEVLGVIAAARGNFDDAIGHQNKALQARHYAEREGAKARARLSAYEGGKAWRE
jgi:tetratricopeptide (TPR) repeat protein